MRTMRKAVLAGTAAVLALGLGVSSAQATAAPVGKTGSSTSTGVVKRPVAKTAGGLAYCQAGTWTQVNWYVNPFWSLSYRYDVPGGGFVRWRWFSGGIPPYWENSFTGSATIWTPPSWYTSVEFLCTYSAFVYITPTS